MKKWFLVLSVFQLLSCGGQNPENQNADSIEKDFSEQENQELPFLVTISPNGSFNSFDQIPKDFWDERGIPLGGARLIEGNLVWIQRISSSQHELRSFDGSEERILLNDAEWENPMLRLGFFPPGAQKFYLYTCVAFGAGCSIGKIYEIDFDKNLAVLKLEAPTAEDFNRDFPFGHLQTFHDEKWFAFWQGEFWARVPRKNKSPVIISYDGNKIKERFDALFAGDPEQFPIDDQIILLESSQVIVYINSLLVFNPVDNQYHESIWHLVEQNASQSSQTRNLLGSWVEAKNRLEELGISAEIYRKFRKTEFSTEWVTALAMWNQKLVEVLSRNLTTSRIKTSSGEYFELPNSEVQIVIQTRSNLN